MCVLGPVLSCDNTKKWNQNYCLGWEQNQVSSLNLQVSTPCVIPPLRQKKTTFIWESCLLHNGMRCELLNCTEGNMMNCKWYGLTVRPISTKERRPAAIYRQAFLDCNVLTWRLCKMAARSNDQCHSLVRSDRQTDRQNSCAEQSNKKNPITGQRCPEGSRKLRFPDFVTVAQNGGKVVSLTHR